MAVIGTLCACKHFSTDVILATGFIHILPAAMTSLTLPCLSSARARDYTIYQRHTGARPFPQPKRSHKHEKHHHDYDHDHPDEAVLTYVTINDNNTYTSITPLLTASSAARGEWGIMPRTWQQILPCRISICSIRIRLMIIIRTTIAIIASIHMADIGIVFLENEHKMSYILEVGVAAHSVIIDIVLGVKICIYI
ncbi:LOW QUALITY PROTEIN: hypothetical protein BC936DRAFT_146581 [Jimgerdemannia flammicorona]|uniref:Uncharacterized protein n=1 Tax=Jimgerdemannia flammicorona TaxID=994334 RepID=A0A433D7C3_9FUNG|nr:LOW QUALITY PROTEIN: hypothetical protein BC936DRAFT_146581 [Jimgerdemannia flammicorona]